MSAPPPLTHHEIIALVRPFTARGRHVDLARSHRLDRRLAFRPIDHAAMPPELPALREDLELQCLGDGGFRLTRTLTHHASGLQATLQASGPDPGVLLADIEAVAPQRQVRAGPGFVIARCHVMDAVPGAPAERLFLTQGLAQLDGLRLKLGLLPLSGVPADIVLHADSGDPIDLPEDLLAVLGWDWVRLERTHEGWKTRLRLRGPAPRRSASAEAALDRATGHLARTLAEPPGHFHDRHRAARWGVMLRRSMPTLTAACLVTAVALLPRLSFENGPGPWLMLFHLPTALLALSFCLQELSRFEIPPWPRRSAAPGWRQRPSGLCAAAARRAGG